MKKQQQGDGILTVQFFPETAETRFYGAYNHGIEVRQGAILHVRWDGEVRRITVSRARGMQALKERIAA